MNKNIFKINIDTHIIKRLRDKINEQQNISYNIESYDKKYGTYRAWDKICAIMDRLDDTVDYLNQLKLNTGKHRRSAFDFFDFMNNASVVIDCITELAKVFDIKDEEVEISIDIFNKPGKDGKGSDKRYFEYLRSLCSVHPIETSRHKMYQENKFECSPYVLWNDKSIFHDCDSDIYAVVYTSKDGEHFKRIPIYIDEIFKYITRRVDFIETIIIHIDRYQQNIIESYRSENVKTEQEFDDYTDYLKNLNKELEKRYGKDTFYNFDCIIKLFELELSNSENKEKMELYLNALKYSIQFEHNSIQHMSCDGFENNGLLYPEKNIQTSLLYELELPNSGSEDRRKYGYQIEKISYLGYGSCHSYDRDWAYTQLKVIMPFLERYVTFENVQSDFEYYALVKLALYLECLDNDCLINRNIPNDLKYRTKYIEVQS